MCFRTNFLDQEWFVFETAGTLVVGWEGGPLHHANVTEPGERRTDMDSSKLDTGRVRDPDDSECSTDDELTTVGSNKKTKTEALDLAGYERPKTTTTGIEIAAAMATGMLHINLIGFRTYVYETNGLGHYPSAVEFPTLIFENLLELLHFDNDVRIALVLVC